MGAMRLHGPHHGAHASMTTFGWVLTNWAKDTGSDGIVYQSVRWPAGQAAGLFWPNLIRMPVTQARTLQYHWDGTQMTRYFIIGETDWYARPTA